MKGVERRSRLWKSGKQRTLSTLHTASTTAKCSQLWDTHSEGKVSSLTGPSNKLQVTAEQMEISRLRAELARVTMERDILGKATAFFAKGQK